MLRQVRCLLFFIILLVGCKAVKSQVYNFGIENLDANGKPLDWNLGFSQEMKDNYPVIVDSLTRHSGKYALRISGAKKATGFGAGSIAIPSVFRGEQIVLKGFLKTENVKNGYAGLWLRLDGESGNPGFDNMNNRGLTGTNNWKEFSIKLNFSEDVQTINAGALLTGEGTVWVDDLSVEIDGRDLTSAPSKTVKFYPATLDTTFNQGSGITIQLNDQRREALTALGQVWGFLKYHHPSIAEGKYNWDAELMRIFPAVLAARSKNEWLPDLEKWVDKLPVPPACSSCKVSENTNSIKLQPDYGDLFKQGYLSSSLANKLKYIKVNSNNSFNYYIRLVDGIGNPNITNEKAYRNMAYPDAGFRLLALYRYWNLIQYFFPYRHLIGEDWSKVLPDMLPAFINAKDSTEYALACLKLIARVNDTHANIWEVNKALEAYRGKYYPPISTTFIENKLVVKNIYSDTLDVKQRITKGDIITRIDGKPVKEHIKELLPLTPASNYSTKLRDISRSILRGQTDKVSLTVLRNNKEETIVIPRYESWYRYMSDDFDPNPSDSSYKIIDHDIGYVYPGKYKNEQLPAIEEAFKNTKGIVVDMRCYPSSFMPFTFGNYIKQNSSPFVVFTVGSVQHPGLFTFGEPLVNGGNSKNSYTGKVVVIVNEQSQSQAEYTTMAFQSSPNVTVIGSTTTGADGNVSGFYLPGGVFTMFSGIGIYYPNKMETQRSGVKIDVVLQPTLKGFKEGKDELLQKAIQLIRER